MLLMIDNYDSFTYNLVQYLGELGADVRVFRNDAISLDDVARLAPERIVVSPGPCTPLEAGISVLAIYNQLLPPTANLDHPDPDCDLDYVPKVARKADVTYALSNSFGFGGTNAALLFKKFES